MARRARPAYVTLHVLTASAERYDVDGAVWCVDFVEARRRLPRRLTELLEEDGANTLTAEMLGRVAPTHQDLMGSRGDWRGTTLRAPSPADQRAPDTPLFGALDPSNE